MWRNWWSRRLETRRLYIFTHGDRRESVAQRFEAMMAGFDAIDHDMPQQLRPEATERRT